MAAPAFRRRLIAAAMLIALPFVTWYVWVCLRFFDGAFVAPWSASSTVDAGRLVPTLTAVSIYAGWWLLQISLHVMLPARVCDGPAASAGCALRYRLNGLLSFLATAVIVVVIARSGVLTPGVLCDEFGPLLVTANLAAFALAAWAHWRGRLRAAAARRGLLEDYLYGLELNPRVGGVDLKFFCESRPSLLFLVVVNASLAARQYELHGSVTTPMLLVNAFQLLYVADFFVHEGALLTTWDIKHERFGWMLCWGCLVWVPFMFSLQAQYLVTHTHDLPPLAVAGISALNFAGYTIFRSANLQKHRFRCDPSRAVSGRPPDYIRTAAGPLLLTSGWWGRARHANYLGDLLMGLAWCLPAGFRHPLPYFYIVYFVVLLVHRERRDHALCLQKYGSDWEDYCRKVPWRIVPGLY